MHVFIESGFYSEKVNLELSKKNLIPIFLYSLDYKNKNTSRDLVSDIKNQIKKQKPNFKAILIDIHKIDNSLIGFLNSLKQDFDIVIVKGGYNKINRFVLESTNVDFLMDPHSSSSKKKFDFIHHFNSGLNHVLISLASENRTYILNTLNSFNNKSNVYKEVGRINQNLVLARKKELPIGFTYIISSEEFICSERKLEQTLSMFDISTKQKKEATRTIGKVLSRNKLRKSEKFIDDKIQLL